MATKRKKEEEKKDRKPKGREIEPVRKIKIRVVGIGGGAGSIVADIASELKGVKFLAANTDGTSLAKFKRSKRISTFQFGEKLTGGFGTGMDMKLGYHAALEAKEEIKKILQGYDLCFLITCLGGGTGSGANPVFAEVSKNLGNLTVGIFTLPFDFEGKKKIEIAKESLKKTIPFLNAITIVPNERIFKIVDRKLPIKKALSLINNTLAFNLEGLLEMIYKAGIINIDFADIKTILSGNGDLAYLNRVEAKGEGRAKKAIQEVLNNPLYPYNISEAKKILFNIAGPSDLSLLEVSQISQAIFESAQQGSKIIFGVSQIKEKGKIEISLLALGCSMNDFFPKEGKKKKRRSKKKTKDPEKTEKFEQAEEKPIENQKEKDVKEAESAEEEQKKKLLVEPRAKKKQAKEQSKKKKGLKSALDKKQVPQKEEKLKVRKNALQVQKDIQALEDELRKEEEVWEIPAFLRKKT